MFSSNIHHPQPHHLLPFSHHLHLTRHASDDDVTPTRPTLQTDISRSGQAPTAEVGRRRPRGRPPGSKNKPKPPPAVIANPNSMSPYILEVAGGTDVVDAVSRFCRRRDTGLCVIAGSGAVSSLTLRQPSPAATNVTFYGRFSILSISATFLPHDATSAANSFSVSLAGPQGQIVGGVVDGPLVAAGPVFVVAAALHNPSYHRLPDEDQDRDQLPPLCGGGDSARQLCSTSLMYSSYHAPPAEVVCAAAPSQRY